MALGKVPRTMSVNDVKSAFTRVTQDKKLDSKDVDTVLESAGNISRAEEKALREEATRYTGMTDPEAAAKLRARLGDVSALRTRADQINDSVDSAKAGLDADIKWRLSAANGQTFGGTRIPDAVKTLMSTGIAAGNITPYDVREMDEDPVYQTDHGDPVMTLDGKYNPYAQNQRAVDSMAFDYTELTPEKIAADLTATQTWRELDGYEGTGQQARAKFKTVTGVPSGRITELYDEARWSETKARGPNGQKYASNFAILADGSLHAVPASRRTLGDPGRILTTASLARGKQMVFNGHLHMEKGVVTYVGLSGRLSKLQEKGDAKFVDAIALLKAWGFKTAPGLTVTKEG